MIDFAKAYEERSRGQSIFSRANSPKAARLLLYGAPKCGKSTLALELTRHYRQQILIDCADLRLSRVSLQSELDSISLDRQCGAIIIDNYPPELSPPNHPNLILITQAVAKLPESIRKDFSTHCVRPLSFEEYVSFSRGSRLESLFASFLKEGNLPEMPFTPEYKRIQRSQEIALLYAKQNVGVLSFLLRYQAKSFKIYNAFCLLKQQQKISKDTIYALIQTLKDEQVIFTSQSAPSPESKRRKDEKLYFYNFALPYAISPMPNFQAIFENMIACELLHRSLPICCDYGCDFLIGSVVLFATPFPSQALIEARLADITCVYSDCLFISVDSPSASSGTEGANCAQHYRIISFIDFALEYLPALSLQNLSPLAVISKRESTTT